MADTDDEPRPDGRRRTFVPVVLLGVASAGVAAVAGTKPWVSGEAGGIRSDSSGALGSALSLDSVAESPLAAALSLVLLACWGVLLVTRGRFRRAIAVLIEEGKAISPEASQAMLDILHQQRFRSGIPAGLPEDARVANKTGEISTIAHDAGIVYLDGRDAYVVVILTEWAPDVNGRQETIARISRAVYEAITGRKE